MISARIIRSSIYKDSNCQLLVLSMLVFESRPHGKIKRNILLFHSYQVPQMSPNVCIHVCMLLYVYKSSLTINNSTGKQFHTPCRPMYKPSLYICASLTLRKSSKEPRELSFLSLCRSLMREEVLEASRHCFFPPPQGLPTLPSLMVCGQYTK